MKKKISIFYSWQSGAYDKENRYLISDCLKNVSKKMYSDGITVTIEQDTRGSNGSADIPHTLFEKIENADIFIGDVSIINSDSKQERKTPNPNVMIELGYAASRLGWDRVISVCNLKFGKREDSPFDISHRRILAYDTTVSISDAKKKLTNVLYQTIKQIVVSLQRFDTEKEQLKRNLAHLCMDGIRYAWYDVISNKEENILAETIYKAESNNVKAPIILENHFQQIISIQNELPEKEFMQLTELLDIIKKMRSGTENAYGWEYTKQLAKLSFESVWLEYSENLASLPMEKCLRKSIIDTLNCLLPEKEQLSYESLRLSENGSTVFYSDGKHLEAYSTENEVLINVDLDDKGKITGWKKEYDYQGYFADGLRHGQGIEFSHKYAHSGEIQLSGYWDKNKFVEGIIYKAILFKDEELINEYEIMFNDGFPFQIYTVDMEFLIGEFAPDECKNLYFADVQLHNNVFNITGTPEPICCKLGGTERITICYDCEE